MVTTIEQRNVTIRTKMLDLRPEKYLNLNYASEVKIKTGYWMKLSLNENR